MSNTKNSDSGAAEGARRATEQTPESGRAGAGRWSSGRKTGVVLELLRGADVEATSRKYRVTAATLTEWRERFLAGGEASMKSREASPEDEEKRRLKSVVATVSVENELLREKIARLEEARPLAPWRSRA
jgi:transposase-like protein